MLRAAIYGAGHWGTRLIESVHGKSDKIRFVTAITRDLTSKRGLAGRFGLFLTTSYADVLADPAIDAVVLCTPHSQHAAEVIAAAKAGKHVFCEKPFTLTTKDAQVRNCRLQGRRRHAACRVQPPLCAGLCRNDAPDRGRRHRQSPSYRRPILRPAELPDRARQLARQPDRKSGRLHGRARRPCDRQHGASRRTRATVFAFSGRLQHEIDVDDTTSCLLRFAGSVTGYLGTLHATAAFYRIHTFGSKGALEMRGETELLASDLAGKVERLTFDVADKERAVLEAFADGVASGTKFVIAPEEIINTVAVMQAVTASSRSGASVTIG